MNEQKEVDQNLVNKIRELIDQNHKETGQRFEIRINQVGDYKNL